MAEAFASKGIAGLILAGGQGARMNGQDKGLVVLRGEPMVAHVARRLAPQVSRLVISANRHLDLYARYGAVVQDGEADLGAWQGPLLGIAAGLDAARQEAWLVVAPCDTPFLPKDLAARLVRAAESANAPMAYAVADGQRHSACMALRTSLLPDLLAYLRAGDRKVGLWQARMGAVEACFDDAPDAFMNVNTPDELARAERYASQ
ncbi:Molybdenum cofactor guanylyltransferase [Achromobacter aegrifaciens]|uniref:molybdenum cofactor guanylyltransferase MobA n=1 Tax=Achromobacter aegrifaciens TaxID=1287736 RepID=UPI0014654176|nr:molybdenum cofactor guanylyltransferase MobA [Achromobacter aegrifaciens]CAB3920415.1 Molybdenum cofactor guanylyltransferase [Achromobacter aegrifaciens]